MIDVKSYLNDGANWQAQCVLAYLRENSYRITSINEKARVLVGRFENNREQGYVFRLEIDYHIMRNYAVYEHRNSDQLIVFESENHTLNTPTIDEIFNGRTKYQYNKAFHYGQIMECGDYILDDMESRTKDYIANNQL